MSTRSADDEAVVICTRNRPAYLSSTLESICEQAYAQSRVVLVVDASDPKVRRQNASTIDALSDLPVRHLPYPNPPSSARQRNCAIDRLSPSIEIVHFVDDDVTLQDRYFLSLRRGLKRHTAAAGVGPVVQEPGVSSAPNPSLLRRLFLLDNTVPGRVLPSGHAVPAQLPDRTTHSAQTADWLNGCSTYRRSILDQHRFAPQLQGYSMLEDLDLSYRISRTAPLYVIPEARLVHHRSPVNRKDAEDYMYHQIVHRRWFVEKNLGRAFHRAAFWWATLGQALATRSSSRPEARAAYRGLVRGVQTVLRRDHPLLS